VKRKSILFSPALKDLSEEYPFAAGFYAFLTSIFFTCMIFSWLAARFFNLEESNLVRPQKPNFYKICPSQTKGQREQAAKIEA
jgi:hypothetical protein